MRAERPGAPQVRVSERGGEPRCEMVVVLVVLNREGIG